MSHETNDIAENFVELKNYLQICEDYIEKNYHSLPSDDLHSFSVDFMKYKNYM